MTLVTQTCSGTCGQGLCCYNKFFAL